MTNCNAINNFIKDYNDNFMNMNNSQLLNCDKQNIQEFCSLSLNNPVINSCYDNIKIDDNFFGSEKSTIIENFPILFRSERISDKTLGNIKIDFSNLGFTYSNILKFPLNIFQWNPSKGDIKGVFSTISKKYYYIIYSQTNIIRINDKFENKSFNTLDTFIDDFVKKNAPDSTKYTSLSSFLKLNIRKKRIQCVISTSFDLVFKDDKSDNLVFLNSPENSVFKIKDDNSKFVYINNTPEIEGSPVYLCISENNKITIYYSALNQVAHFSKIVLQKDFPCQDIWLVNKSNIDYLVCYKNDNTYSYFKSPITLVDCFDKNSPQRIVTGSAHGTPNIVCKNNEVMTGACTSGSKKDCDGNSFKIVCTKINEGHTWSGNIRVNNSSKNQGSWNYCDVNEIGKEEAIIGLCSSGHHADCNNKKSANQAYCALNPFIYTSNDRTSYFEGRHSVGGKQGVFANCNTSDADYQHVIKFCTSGHHQDCILKWENITQPIDPAFAPLLPPDSQPVFTAINCSKECKVLKQLSEIPEEDMDKLNEKIKIYDFYNNLENLADNAKRFYWDSFTLMTKKNMYSPHNRIVAIYKDGQIELSLINTTKILNKNSIRLYNNGNITTPSFKLVDNGIWQTNTLFTKGESEFIEYNIEDKNYKITKNSNYIIKRDDNNIVTVYINKYNSPLFKKYCIDNKSVDCTQIFKNYCKNINNDKLELGDNTPLGEFVDDSCTCVANQLIAKKFFKNNSANESEIKSQAPCLFDKCTDFTDSNKNTYIHDEISNTCNTITAICNTIVNNKGQISNETFDQHCGSGGLNLTCENTGCPEGQKCVNKECVPVKKKIPDDKKKHKTTQIIILIILLVILFVSLYFLLKN